MSNHITRLAFILRLALLASLVSLGAAYTAQYGFGLKPCHLCYYQRVPFAVVIALSLLGMRRPHWRGWLVGLVGVAFLINSGIASYHTAVEKHWVEGPSGCTTGEAPAHESSDDFLKRLKATPIVLCDVPQWEWNGITMAGMNAVWCLFLALYTFAALQQSRRKERAHAQAAG